jgi:uncharacterized phage protein (TIGR01671 family)
MKREIKFKLYNKHVNRQVSAPACYYMSVNDDGSMAVMNNIAVCQFTGLTDKNGKEIYEGDVLSVDNYKVLIKFIGGQFVGYNSNYAITETQNRNWLQWTVIGNIYENPELL